MTEPRSVYPSRHGWWLEQEGNALGQSQPLAALPGVNVARVVLEARRIGPPQLVTIALARQDIGALVSSDFFCRVQYAVGGVTETVELDWTGGVLFSVTAVSVTVSLVTFNPSPEPYDPARAVNVSATVVANPRPGGPPPTRTHQYNVLAGGDTGFVDIPRFARVLSVAGRNSLGAPATIYDATTNVTMRGASAAFSAYYLGTSFNAGSQIVVPGWARQYRVENLSGVDRQYSAAFGLSL